MNLSRIARSISDKSLVALVIAVLLYLYLPILVLMVFSFNDSSQLTLPLQGFTLSWYQKMAANSDLLAALWNSLYVAVVATALTVIVGVPAALALDRFDFPGKTLFRRLVLLPLVLPGIITGISLRSAFNLMDIPFSFWTIVLGHATFCIVVVYNNAVARFRRLHGSLVEAAMDLGADGFQTFRYVILPNLGTALLAGGMLAFALSFDEVIVTTFTAGQQQTLPIWMLEELIRPRQRPVTNVVAMVVVLVTFLPILAAFYLTRGGEQSTAGMGK